MPTVYPIPAPLPALLPGGSPRAPETAGYTVVNQWTLTAEQSYGMQAAAVSNTPGNMLVVFAAWVPGYEQAVNPVSNVADDANDWWVHLGTTPEAGFARCSMWVCPNARRGPGSNGGSSVVSVATSWPVPGFAALVVEIAGAPQFAVSDFEDTAYGTGTSLTASGTATAAVLAFAVNAAPGGDITGPSGWNTLAQVTSSGGVVLTPAWLAAPAGTVSATWDSSPSQQLAGLVTGLLATPAQPAQSNPSFPQLSVQAAFGYQPGNASSVPSYTDISSRVIDRAGSAVLKTRRGRSYELTQPEAGELAARLRNSDSAFDPTNITSPFWPDVAVEMLVQAYAYWDGSYYAVGTGYTERVPQSWPELPQYGFTPLVAADGISVLANTALPSALAGDYLIDFPYAYIPCGEEYAAGETVTSEVYGSVNAGAAGLTLANLSRTNTTPAVCVNGIARLGSFPDGTGLAYYFLETGLTLGLTSAVSNSPTGVIGAPLLSGLLGDPGGGIGISQLPASGAGLPGWVSNGLFTSPGARYIDPGLPQMPAGITAEWWAILPSDMPSGFSQDLIRLTGSAYNYFVSAFGARRLDVHYGASGVLQVTMGDYAGNSSAPVTGSISLGDGNPHFYSVTVTQDGSDYQVSLYVDGNLLGTGTTSGISLESDVSFWGLGPVMSSDGGQWAGWNYTIGHAAVFPAVLSQGRIQAHYQAGLYAWTGDSAPQRIARIMAWSGFGLARACDLGSPSPVFGPADQVQGQSATAALYSVAQQDNGMLYCDAAGNVTYRSRMALYNRPVKWWFGDAPVPGGALNENPYFQDSVLPWEAVNGAVISLSDIWSHTGTWSLLITGNGATADPGAVSERISVIPGVTYMVTAWCYSPQGWSTAQASITWYTSSGTEISVSAGAALDMQPLAAMILPQVTATAPGNAVTAAVTVQMNGTPAPGVQMLTQPVIFASAEVPTEKPTTFGFDNTFLWNLLTAHLQVNSAYSGSSATAINEASQEQYFTRGGANAQIDQTLETLSYQDVLDIVNWSLARYQQPQLRMKQIVVDAAGKSGSLATWPTVLGIEQGDIVQVTRRPIGGTVITQTGIVQKVQHDIGPSKWTTTILVVPYSPAGSVLTADTNDTVGSAAMPW
jgi:hypothetical protein